MGVYPNQFSREDFLEKFLKENNVSDSIITKFVELPEKIIIDGHEYGLYVNVIFCSVGDTSYTFELNYYCEELVEFLFNSKVFGNVETSINYLMCELLEKQYLEREVKEDE
jgi:hypothetical protein